MSGATNGKGIEHAAERVTHAANLTAALKHIARNAEGDPVDPAALIGLTEALSETLQEAGESLEPHRGSR